MSELWKNLIAREDEALAEELTLAYVTVSRKTGEMRVRFRSDSILNDDQFALVERQMASAFPTVRVRVQLEYPSLRERVMEDISIASSLMKSLVKHESPGCN